MLGVESMGKDTLEHMVAGTHIVFPHNQLAS